MKSFITLSLILMTTGSASAGIISEIQGGFMPEGTFVTVPTAFVMATTETGAYIAEQPYTQFNGIYVNLGAGHTLEWWDFCTVSGDYFEANALSIIDVAGSSEPGADYETIGQGLVINLNPLSVSDLMQFPEFWESCRISINEPLTVISLGPGGDWVARADGGAQLRFGDLWYDRASVQVGHRYEWVIGIWNFRDGNFKLEVFADGIDPADPSPDSQSSWGCVKTLFR